MLIGLQLPVEFFEMFLKIGVASANLTTDRNVPSLTEALNERKFSLVTFVDVSDPDMFLCDPEY